ncbi:prepilin-type N-terminal cleavage/methylation domain-containing protein [Catenovulum sp. SM1970]|uniref:type IV pilin protein n=1 Tax=Marinifaba aquimaris TaxID=2741323 RepID=UPI001571656C|nr:type IV pilin protein [Marinifaba aquimaris]NTS76710.1 prepilin-type N-terminal cleavage/methylation domain-containing protein [Marinifaba aquimaris]
MKHRGFSLIELMVGIAIAGILIAIAVPSYQGYLGQGYRSEAMRELIVVVNKQEQYLIENRTYTLDMTELGYGTDPLKSETERFDIDTTAINSITSDFIVSATATSAQLKIDPGCAVISIDYLGNKTAEDKDGNDATSDCWHQ